MNQHQENSDIIFKYKRCPFGCEHPQPFIAKDGRDLCGRCFFKDGLETEMISIEDEPAITK